MRHANAGNTGGGRWCRDGVQKRTTSRGPLGWSTGPILLALGVLVLHMAVSTRYGYFRDALYYIAASRHPALGYFDFPAGVAMVAWLLVGHTFGYTLWALHLPRPSPTPVWS